MESNMRKRNKVIEDLQKVMTNAMLEMQKLFDLNQETNGDFLSIIKIFLGGIISTAIDIAETNIPGASSYLYADVEAIARNGGFRTIRAAQLENSDVNYSISNLAEDDKEGAMNYLGKELSTALFKGIHELPESLRNEESLLRGIEALLTNLLDQKFNNSHAICRISEPYYYDSLS